MSQPRQKRQRCPVCKEFLTLQVLVIYDDWHECRTEDCLLFGMEGLSHHWKVLGKIIDIGKPEVVECRKHLGVAT